MGDFADEYRELIAEEQGVDLFEDYGGMPQPHILDVCCGSRMFWFDKENAQALYLDNRRITGKACDGRTIDVDPDIIADFTELPLPSESFYHVVFDPPHLIRAGSKSWLSQKYGKLEANWQETIQRGFAECWRVLRPGGTLVFKWNEDQIPLSEILKLAPASPAYGNRRAKTHWIVFVKAIDDCRVTTDGYSYDAPLYKYKCLSCGEYFHADKCSTFCPNCGRKIVKVN